MTQRLRQCEPSTQHSICRLQAATYTILLLLYPVESISPCNSQKIVASLLRVLKEIVDTNDWKLLLFCLLYPTIYSHLSKSSKRKDFRCPEGSPRFCMKALCRLRSLSCLCESIKQSTVYHRQSRWSQRANCSPPRNTHRLTRKHQHDSAGTSARWSRHSAFSAQLTSVHSLRFHQHLKCTCKCTFCPLLRIKTAAWKKKERKKEKLSSHYLEATGELLFRLFLISLLLLWAAAHLVSSCQSQHAQALLQPAEREKEPSWYSSQDLLHSFQ